MKKAFLLSLLTVITAVVVPCQGMQNLPLEHQCQVISFIVDLDSSENFIPSLETACRLSELSKDFYGIASNETIVVSIKSRLRENNKHLYDVINETEETILHKLVKLKKFNNRIFDIICLSSAKHINDGLIKLDSTKQTALSKAVMEDYPSIISKLLLLEVIDLQKVFCSHAGITNNPLHTAARINDITAVQIITKIICPEYSNILMIQNGLKKTALHIAVENKNIEIVEALLGAAASNAYKLIQVKNKNGKSAYELAMNLGYSDIGKILAPYMPKKRIPRL